jgi:hypothetical protein
MHYFGTGRLGTHQSAAYTATAGTITNAMGSQTYKVRIVCTTDAFVKVGDAPTATTSDPLFPANSVAYVTITPGQKVSAVQSSAGGTLHVTEVV